MLAYVTEKEREKERCPRLVMILVEYVYWSLALRVNEGLNAKMTGLETAATSSVWLVL